MIFATWYSIHLNYLDEHLICNRNYMWFCKWSKLDIDMENIMMDDGNFLSLFENIYPNLSSWQP